jgi:tetratricopeptide (TPR) repeat protein
MTMLSFGHRRNSYVRFRTQIFALCIVLFICEHAQPQQMSTTELNDRINQDLRLIKVAEHDHLSNSKLGYLWGHLASDYAQQADFTRAEDAYFHSIRLLKDVPEAQVNYATLLDNLGVLYLAYNRKSEAHQYLMKAIVMRRQQDNKSKLGITLVHLAELAISDHKFKDAENLATEAHASLITAEDDLGRKGFIGALVALTYARCSRNNCAEGLRNANQAMELAQIAYPSDSVPIGHVLMGLGFAKWKSGDSQEAEKMMLQGVHLITTLNVPGAQYSRNALSEYRTFLQAMHRSVDVKRIDDQLARTSPQPCAACTVNVNSMSNSMR